MPKKYSHLVYVESLPSTTGTDSKGDKSFLTVHTQNVLVDLYLYLSLWTRLAPVVVVVRVLLLPQQLAVALLRELLHNSWAAAVEIMAQSATCWPMGTK